MDNEPIKIGEFLADGHKSGYTITRKGYHKKATSPPLWVLNDKSLKKKLYSDADLKYKIARLYWYLNWTAKDIAIEIYGDANKFRAIESIIKRIKQL